LNKKSDQDKVAFEIRGVKDIVAARQYGRALALESCFSMTDATIIATAISELVRNIVLYADTGELQVGKISNPERSGIVIIARDEGPVIADVERALMGGYSTSGGLGVGMSGVRALMDDFSIETEVDQGTTIVAKKWIR
jgi:serine/threonine-protein kinase RsbT